METNSLNNSICHLSFPKKLSPTHTHPLLSICGFLKPYDWLFLEFESFVKGWKWIRKTIHSIILYVTCHSLRNFPLSYTSTHILWWIFETLQVVISWVWGIHKRLNVNWKKNSLSNFICNLSWLKKLPPNHTHPLISIHKFSKPYKLLFLDFESFIKFKKWIVKKNHPIIVSVTCHGLGNFPPLMHSPSYPFVNFLKPYKWDGVGHEGTGWVI